MEICFEEDILEICLQKDILEVCLGKDILEISLERFGRRYFGSKYIMKVCLEVYLYDK